MKLFILLFSLLIFKGLAKTSLTSSTNSDEGSPSSYVGMIIIASIALINLLLFFICYKNTQRLRKEAQELRIQINQEYENLKAQQNLNMAPGMFQMNYYLVYPNDPRYLQH